VIVDLSEYGRKSVSWALRGQWDEDGPSDAHAMLYPARRGEVLLEIRTDEEPVLSMVFEIERLREALSKMEGF